MEIKRQNIIEKTGFIPKSFFLDKDTDGTVGEFKGWIDIYKTKHKDIYDQSDLA